MQSLRVATTVAIALVVVLVAPLVLLSAQTAASPGLEDVNALGTAALGAAAAAALGLLKVGGGWLNTRVVKLDQKVVNLVKPVQPLLVLGLAWLLPRAGAAIGVLPPDAGELVNAPLATLIGVTAREGARRLFRNRATSAFGTT